MLLEAIDLLFAEMNELDRNGPSFKIVHCYSQGSCAPGEEVSAVLLADHGEFRQLPLAVVERLVFDFLAQHRRIGLDSSQIVSGLSGGWFYREHAANSGHRQVKRVRRARPSKSSFNESGTRWLRRLPKGTHGSILGMFSARALQRARIEFFINFMATCVGFMNLGDAGISQTWMHVLPRIRVPL